MQCANGFLLNQVVRRAWNWSGYVISDCDAIQTMMIPGAAIGGVGAHRMLGHSYSMTGAAAVFDGIKNGCDSNCGSPYTAFGDEAIATGLVTEAMLNVSVRRMLRPLFQLGLFDPIAEQPYTMLGWDDVGTAQARKLALDGARQSLVLLQNPVVKGQPVLPLLKNTRVLVVGPHFDATTVLLGQYVGSVCPDERVCSGPNHTQNCHLRPSNCMVPLVEWINRTNGEGGTTVGTRGTNGCTGLGRPRCSGGKQTCNSSDPFRYDPPVNRSLTLSQMTEINRAANQSRGYDAVVLAVGYCASECEGNDREILGLYPGEQQLYDAVISALSGTETKVVVVLINGGPVSVGNMKNRSAAIIQTGFPGQSGGQAIAETLFGVTNPSGKLTTTIYNADYAVGIPMSGMPWVDTELRPHMGFPGRATLTPGRTYRYFTGTPEFEFVSITM